MRAAFTIMELLVVMTVILILAGLVLATSGYIQKKGGRSRAQAEIAALSTALENYKADNGIYPITSNTNALDARTNPDPSNYNAASLDLYAALTGDTNGDRTTNASDLDPNAKSYLNFKLNMLAPRDQTATVRAIIDPFGNSYGYSTIHQSNPNAGYNPTFDLWSTAGGTTEEEKIRWIKNW